MNKCISYENYIGTLVKIINPNNMTEIWGILDEFDGTSATITKGIIGMNRCTADLATTFNDIIQYKFNVNESGSTITVPLSPVYDNTEKGSTAIINLTNWVFIPLYHKDKIDVDVKDIIDNEPDNYSLIQALNLRDNTLEFINNIYERHRLLMLDIFQQIEDEKLNAGYNNDTSNDDNKTTKQKNTSKKTPVKRRGRPKKAHKEEQNNKTTPTKEDDTNE